MFTGSPELGTPCDGDTWLTPRYILEQLGEFDIDPCPAPQNPNWVTRHVLTDGLRERWEGRVFMNPPFSDTRIWLEKHALHGDGISLVSASVESKVWRKYVWPVATAILLLHGRTRFCNPDGSTTTGRPLRSIALIAWTDNDAGYLERSTIAGVLLKNWLQR